jgi:hypothetical protein
MQAVGFFPGVQFNLRQNTIVPIFPCANISSLTVGHISAEVFDRVGDCAEGISMEDHGLNQKGPDAFVYYKLSCKYE